MIAPEHLDWHTNTEEYIESKQQLFRWQTSEDIAVYFDDDQVSRQIASTSLAKKIAYFGDDGAHIEDGKIVIDGKIICDAADIRLPGKHNWQNICAAITATWQITQDVDAIRNVIITFSGMHFRLELIREFQGVKYYNDSFGTTPETAIVAIESFEQPKILILGGSDKGAEFEQLAKVVASNNVKVVVTIGQLGNKIADQLSKAGFNNIITGGNTMDDIVRQAQSAASEGDVVLLSPACASFDMFKNYQDRGEQFNQAVQSLA